MFEHELIEARKKYMNACNYHAQMVDLRLEGAASEQELMQAIEDMRQAQEELEEARSNYC
ncbi:hypothetical protein [Vibrio coralliirubri]|uniref:hypothetical protein n=1 Tax=Vibrio coralliirubri TaxID=1516159 RepID=UPI00076A2488|nr:hypothetical protein [Vibrio coralliirubri]